MKVVGRVAPSRHTVTFVGITFCVAAVGQIRAESDTEIMRVSLSVRDGASVKPSAGVLYQSSSEQRKYVADIGEDGKPDRSVKCGSSDQFEAEAESRLDRPVVPIRLPCKAILAFTFKRMFITASSWNELTPGVSDNVSPKVYTSYAAAFEKAGKPVEAGVWHEAAKTAVAYNLGDTKLDKFVFRDPSKGYKLEFTPSGEAALKAKQTEFGVAATGKVDSDTQNAFATITRVPKDVAPLKCTLGVSRYQCEKPAGEDWVHAYATDTPDPRVVVLPKHKF